jgi:hypothetical protein
MRILAVAHDPGGANAVAAETAALRARGVDVIAIAKGLAENQFRRLAVEFVPFHPEAVDAVLAGNVDLVLTGTSVADSLDRDATAAARARGIPSVTLIDYWMNHDTRFGVARPPKEVLPDYLIAIDERCRRQMVSEGLPDERTHVLGQPYFSVLLARAAGRTGGPGPVERLLYASESGAAATRALDTLLRALGSLESPVELIVRFHPREGERADRLDRLRRAGCPFVVDESFDPLETARAADAVIGVSSMILIETSLLGVPTAAFGGDVRALADYGLSVPLASEEDVIAFLQAPRLSAPDAAFLARQRDAAERVAEFCVAVARGSQDAKAATT